MFSGYAKFKMSFWNTAKWSMAGAAIGAGVGLGTQPTDASCAHFVGRDGNPYRNPIPVLATPENQACIEKLVQMSLEELRQLGRTGYLKSDNPLWIVGWAIAGACLGAILGICYNNRNEKIEPGKQHKLTI